VDFVTKRDVLTLISRRAREDKPTSFRTLVRELGLSPDAACSHLRRLWRDRLIADATWPEDDPRSPQPGESIRDLRFSITRRGKELLQWHEERDKEEREEQEEWSG
jgi:hypothetical protein